MERQCYSYVRGNGVPKLRKPRPSLDIGLIWSLIPDSIRSLILEIGLIWSLILSLSMRFIRSLILDDIRSLILDIGLSLPVPSMSSNPAC